MSWLTTTLPPMFEPVGPAGPYWTDLTADQWAETILSNPAWVNVTSDQFAALVIEEWAALTLNEEEGETEMHQGTYGLILSACGVSIQTNVQREATMGIEPVDTDLPVGQAGSLTTRTDNDTGVATLSTGHGIQTGDVVDVYWDGGVRYGMDATVSVNAVTLDAGVGDNLPTEAAAVVVCKQIELDVTFDGDNLVMIGAGSEYRSHLTFIDGTNAVLAAVEIAAGEAWAWVSNTGTTNPLAGNAVAKVAVSNGDSSNVNNLKLTGLQYSAA